MATHTSVARQVVVAAPPPLPPAAESRGAARTRPSSGRGPHTAPRASIMCEMWAWTHCVAVGRRARVLVFWGWGAWRCGAPSQLQTRPHAFCDLSSSTYSWLFLFSLLGGERPRRCFFETNMVSSELLLVAKLLTEDSFESSETASFFSCIGVLIVRVLSDPIPISILLECPVELPLRPPGPFERGLDSSLTRLFPRVLGRVGF